MKLLTFKYEGKESTGVLIEDQVIELEKLIELHDQDHGEELQLSGSLNEIIKRGSDLQETFKHLNEWIQTQKESVYKKSYPLEKVDILKPGIHPGKVVCVGNNYMDHCIEQNVEPPKQPMIFSKWPSCLIGDGESIELPEESQQVDYEAELAVVIGKKGKNIPEEEAYDYIFGYTILNDVSARDVQFADVQWVRGKSYDTFAPIGPVIVTKDEIEDPHNLDIRLEVNGEALQDSNTKNLIFNIPYIISYLSKGFTFEPGDIIATGTPHGVGVFRDPQVFLKSGDKCKIEIESVGILENPVL